MKTRSSLLGSCISAIPNLAVLLTLIGIGYWGHTHHWKIPKFSDLIHGNHGSRTVADSHAAPVATNASKSATSDGGTQSSESDSIPTIQFASGDALRKSGITVGHIQERSMDEFVHAYGTVTYDETRLAQLSCRVPGIVWRVEKQLGDTVKKGDILAIYDSNEVGRAKAEVLEADVKSDLANQTLERLTHVGDAVPARTVREAEAEVRMSAVRRFNAQQALLNLGLPISMQAMTGLSDTDLADRLHFLGLPPEVVASLDRDTASANLIPLISPLDGMVIRRNIVTGELADPDQPQFTVADVRKMWLILNVRKEDATGLEIGQTVFFSSTGLPGEVESKLTWIATETDKRTRSVQVRAEIDNVATDDGTGKPTKWRFRAHTFGTGRVQIRQRPVALVVPNSAIQWDGTRHLIFSPQSDGRSFRAIPVKLGVVQDGYTEVLGDVARGQPVVSTGAYLLKSELMGVEN
jgi:cobalt-zinc-cadmium efflux system membrane fusion protein